MIHDFETNPELAEIAARLESGRAVPRAAFRGELGRKLVADGERHPAPRSLHRLIAAYAGAGAALVAIAALGLVGAGPFGA